jgi:tetratricopeptide (TPR) repeat protein
MKAYPQNTYPVALIVCLCTMLFSGALQAQFVTIFGGNFAHDCYQTAAYATRISDANRQDLEDCNMAISQGRLNRRDLTATYINRGIINVHIGLIGQAEEDYLTALDMSDRTPETFLNLGNLQFMMQNFQGALADYNHAEDLGFNQSHILYLNRGMALYRLGRLDEAEVEYNKALEIRPTWLQAIDKIEQLQQKRVELAEEAALTR